MCNIIKSDRTTFYLKNSTIVTIAITVLFLFLTVVAIHSNTNFRNFNLYKNFDWFITYPSEIAVFLLSFILINRVIKTRINVFAPTIISVLFTIFLVTQNYLAWDKYAANANETIVSSNIYSLHSLAIGITITFLLLVIKAIRKRTRKSK